MSEKSPINRQAFAKSCRLSHSKEFSRVFEKAEKASDRYFLVLARKQQQGYARLGLAVAKKHAKLAVQRNRLKRIIRESFRLKQSSMPSIDVIVMIRPQAAKAEKKVLRKNIDNLWEKTIQPSAGNN